MWRASYWRIDNQPLWLWASRYEPVPVSMMVPLKVSRSKIAAHKPRNLMVLRQFFRFARRRHIILIDPTIGVNRQHDKGFRGRTLTQAHQRELFGRWTADPTVHPHEALVGLLTLLRRASSPEVRLLRCNNIDADLRTIRLGARPRPVPRDPTRLADDTDDR